MGKEINEQQCSVVTNQKCSPVSRQVCNDVNTPRQVCSDKAEEVCENRSASVTKYVDEEQCSNTGGRKCVPVTRQECSDVVEQVPRTSYETSATLSTLRNAPSLAPVEDMATNLSQLNFYVRF